MHKLSKGRSKKAGMPPGSLIHIGEKKREKPNITLYEYNEEGFEEKEIKNLEDCLTDIKDSRTRWINVDAVSQAKVIEKIGVHYGLHPLVMEDILNTDQRPKIEDYGDYLYIVAKTLYYNDQANEIISEQESIILGKNYVITFGEKDGGIFHPLEERLRQEIGRIRKAGADYLAYCILDLVVDNYFIVLEKISDEIEMAEERLVNHPKPEILKSIHRLKREMLFLHKSVWPLREVIALMERRESPLIKESTEVYLRDVYDHIIQVIDTTETLRDVLSSLLDIYLSSVSNRMNEIMKVLTMISTIFMPLTFIVGLYGMNLKMPEAGWPFTYPIVWMVMIAITVFMLFFFKKKKWW